MVILVCSPLLKRTSNYYFYSVLNLLASSALGALGLSMQTIICAQRLARHLIEASFAAICTLQFISKTIRSIRQGTLT